MCIFVRLIRKVEKGIVPHAIFCLSAAALPPLLRSQEAVAAYLLEDHLRSCMTTPITIMALNPR